MKAVKKIYAILLSGAVLFGAVSCGNPAGAGGDSTITSKNYLDGKKFEKKSRRSSTVYSFDSNEYTVTYISTVRKTKNTIEYKIKSEAEYGYKVDSNLGVMYVTSKGGSECFLDSEDNVIFKMPSSYPDTMAGYRKLMKEAYEAILVESVKSDAAKVDELFTKEFANEIYSTLKKYGYTDETGKTDDEKAWKMLLEKQEESEEAEKASKDRISCIAYELDGKTLKIGNSISGYYPKGSKFDDIVDGWYDFKAYVTDGSTIEINTDTAMHKEHNYGDYRISSVSSDSVTFQKEVWDSDEDCYVPTEKTKTYELEYEEESDTGVKVNLISDIDVNGLKGTATVYFNIKYITSKQVSDAMSYSQSFKLKTGDETAKKDVFTNTAWTVLLDEDYVPYNLFFYDDNTSVLTSGMISVPASPYTVTQNGNAYTADCAKDNVMKHTFTIASADAVTGTLKIGDKEVTLNKTFMSDEEVTLIYNDEEVGVWTWSDISKYLKDSKLDFEEYSVTLSEGDYQTLGTWGKLDKSDNFYY